MLIVERGGKKRKYRHTHKNNTTYNPSAKFCKGLKYEWVKRINYPFKTTTCWCKSFWPFMPSFCENVVKWYLVFYTTFSFNILQIYINRVVKHSWTQFYSCIKFYCKIYYKYHIDNLFYLPPDFVHLDFFYPVTIVVHKSLGTWVISLA